MKTTIIFLIMLTFSTASLAAEYSIPHTFQASSPAVAAEVNANFSAAKNAVDDNFNEIEALKALVQELRDEIDAIKSNSILALDGKISLETSANTTTVVFEGVNVQIVNGENATESANGRGNLIIGYNEAEEDVENIDRSGSHNLVVGPNHSYSSYGGLVAGSRNNIAGISASVTGGFNNAAIGDASSVTGGVFNVAIGPGSSVTGGSDNFASEETSSVTGGYFNEASGIDSSVTGGSENIASGDSSSINGGYLNEASGLDSSIAGGSENIASGENSSVAGGLNNQATGENSSVTGGSDNVASLQVEIAP